MKINNNKPPEGPEQHNIKKPSETSKAGAPAGGAASGPADSIRISKQGKEAAQIVEAIGKLPDVRTDRVNEMKQAIDSGNYNVDAGKVAQKMISEIV